MIAGLEIGKIIIIVVYSQVINKPTINGTFSVLIYFFLPTWVLLRNYGIKQTIFEKYHHNITYGTFDFNVPLPPPY